MKVVIFGASGMVGAGVLRECLADGRVTSVTVVGRTPCGVVHPKLTELLHADFFDYSAVAPRLAGSDACFFCLGVSAAGMSEAAYRHLTCDLTLAAANALVPVCHDLTFCYVSGMGTDSSEGGRTMWARVKGATENALLRLPFKAAYMFRPGFIQPLHGIRSKTRLYRVIYAIVGPLYPVLRRLAPRYVMTTETVGRAMINVAATGYRTPILEAEDINRLAGTT